MIWDPVVMSDRSNEESGSPEVSVDARNAAFPCAVAVDLVLDAVRTARRRPACARRDLLTSHLPQPWVGALHQLRPP